MDEIKEKTRETSSSAFSKGIAIVSCCIQSRDAPSTAAWIVLSHNTEWKTATMLLGNKPLLGLYLNSLQRTLTDSYLIRFYLRIRSFNFNTSLSSTLDCYSAWKKNVQSQYFIRALKISVSNTTINTAAMFWCRTYLYDTVTMLTMTRPLQPVPITRPMTNINKMTQEFHSLSSPSSWSFVMNTSKV